MNLLKNTQNMFQIWIFDNTKSTEGYAFGTFCEESETKMKWTFKHTKLACYSGYVTQAVVNNFTPLLFVVFAESLGLNLAQIASLITINFAMQMCVDMFGARYAERIGYRRVLVISQLTAAAGMILLGTLPFIMPPYMGIIIAIIFYAIGSGLTEVIVSPVVEAIPEKAKSANMSFLHSFYCWGHVYTVIITTIFFAVFGVEKWRYLSYYWAILPLITAVMFAKVPINTFGAAKEEQIGFRGLFRTKLFWVFVLLMWCTGAAELAMAQWSSMFAELSLGVTKNTGDILGPCMFAILMGVARIVYGKISSRVDTRLCLAVSALICIVSYLMATIPDIALLNLAGCALCGFSVGAMWPGVLSLAAKRFPEAGTAIFGLLALSGDVGCFSGPQVVALFSADSNLKAGLLAAVFFPVLMIALVMLLRKRKIRN